MKYSLTVESDEQEPMYHVLSSHDFYTALARILQTIDKYEQDGISKKDLEFKIDVILTDLEIRHLF